MDKILYCIRPRARRVRRAAAVRWLATSILLAGEPLSAAGVQTMPLADPALGMIEGQLSILPGWKGSAVVDRVSDPAGAGTASWSVDVQSADGSRGYRALPVAFHSYSPAARRVMPTLQGQSAFLVFGSTADLLTQQILPRLGLGGEVSAPFAIDRDKAADVLAKQVARGAPNPFTDAAGVIVRNVLPGQEVLVEAITVGFARGSANEMSITQVQLFRAPVGQSRALHDEIARLPEFKPDPNWVRSDQALADRRLAEIQAQGQRDRAQMAGANAINQTNSNAQFAAGQQRMAAQRAQYDQHNSAWRQGQQAKSDSNALFNGYIGDHSVTYKWCNGSTGTVRFVTDSVQSPGAGYQRC